MREAAHYASSRFPRFIAQLRHLPRAYALVWSVSRGLTLLWLALLVLQGLLPTAVVFLTRAVVNHLVAAIKAGGTWEYVRPTLIVAVAMGLVLLTKEALSGITNWVRTAQSLKVRDHIAGLIQRKSVEVDLAFYDFPESYDHLHRARTEANYRPVQLIEDLGILLQNGITFLAMVVILIPFSVILPVAILVSTLPALYVVVQAGISRHEWNRRATVDERRAYYYDAVLTEPQSAAEVRLFGIADYFIRAFASTRQKLRSEQMTLVRRQAVAELVAGLAAVCAIGAAMGWMTWRAIRGLISLGDLALFYQALSQSLSLTAVLLGRVGEFYQNALFLGNLFEFLDLQPTLYSSPMETAASQKIERGVRFENVSFRYPGSPHHALHGLDLEFRPNEMVALVGANGAGKSTLLKLLCRFYDPESGSITLDGVPLQNISGDELRRRITVAFQSPVQYSDSAARNIEFGDLGRSAADRLEQAARLSGADGVFRKLPQGYETQLGREFDNGAQLSLGEWQKIALGRAFYRDAPIVLLDEPTSAMDPWEEAEWAERFREFARGRLAVVITHRLTTARVADRIHVIADGRVVESGTHENLLQVGGHYARAWKSHVIVGP